MLVHQRVDTIGSNSGGVTPDASILGNFSGISQWKCQPRWFDWGELAISRALGDLLLKNSGAGAAGGDGKSTPKVSLDDDI